MVCQADQYCLSSSHVSNPLTDGHGHSWTALRAHTIHHCTQSHHHKHPWSFLPPHNWAFSVLCWCAEAFWPNATSFLAVSLTRQSTCWAMSTHTYFSFCSHSEVVFLPNEQWGCWVTACCFLSALAEGWIPRAKLHLWSPCAGSGCLSTLWASRLVSCELPGGCAGTLLTCIEWCLHQGEIQGLRGTWLAQGDMRCTILMLWSSVPASRKLTELSHGLGADLR